MAKAFQERGIAPPTGRMIVTLENGGGAREAREAGRAGEAGREERI
jgi:hypothetical protein